MGLLSRLLTFPVSGPLWVIEQIADEAERRLYDEREIRTQLTQLEMAYEDGQISEEELEEAEDVLLDRLREARARRGEQPRQLIVAPHADDQER
jgi:hypothetical protein